MKTIHKEGIFERVSAFLASHVNHFIAFLLLVAVVEGYLLITQPETFAIANRNLRMDTLKWCVERFGENEYCYGLVGIF